MDRGISLKDVQGETLSNSFKLTRVGVKGVAKPVQVRRPAKTTTLNVAFDVYVDVPATQRGAHLSRNLEVVGEVVDASVRSPVTGLEDLSAAIAREMLARHGYATMSEVWARADYFLERVSPWGRKSLEPYRIVAKATARRGRPVDVRRAIGVEVVGMTACPCAMETIRDELANDPVAARGLPKNFPIITHNQRNRTTLIVDVDGANVDADDLIELVESSMSAPTYELLKRPEEGRLVQLAHEHPKFVEDVVRDVLAALLAKFPSLSDASKVSVKSESEESIHKHNAFAERTTTMGELRS